MGSELHSSANWKRPKAKPARPKHAPRVPFAVAFCSRSMPTCCARRTKESSRGSWPWPCSLNHGSSASG